MKSTPLRVRFAPSPTGFMHLGNVRAALLNYLFARQGNGTFIVRIEDTDQQRNISPQTIFDDLSWLSLSYDEGPGIGGPYEPYFQSQRTPSYEEHLAYLIQHNHVYRCFCTLDDLEKKRLRQMALRQPPRYDRTCLRLSASDIEQRLQQKVPFMWRFQLDGSSLTIHDMARGPITYDLNHFSDFALTRPDGSFTFIFANFVDDKVMHISHVIRGEDHLSNTANQAALYKVFDVTLPLFWHLPIITNTEGKKLSKRDFGFSLNDLRRAGFLPEAICNYLAIIGLGSFTQEIMSLQELTQALDFNNLASTGHVRYDIEKLRWLNHQWIMRLDLVDLAQRCRLFMPERYKDVPHLSDARLAELLPLTRESMITLADTESTLGFFFERPSVDPQLLDEYNFPAYKNIIVQLSSHIDAATLSKQITALCKEHQLPPKNLFALVRIALTGTPQGHAIADLITLLGKDEVQARINALV
jgi:nondiscriminating glutamyl-tRNA synthetase